VIQPDPAAFTLVPLPLYLTPDQFLPLTSALGAIAGLVLMFWTRLKIWTQKFVGVFTKKGAGEASRTETD
jgi:hypothetical protein